MPKTEDQEYVEALAESWHQTYKKSLTTLLILLSLQRKALWTKDIASAITQRTNGTITLDEKSLHRALRRMTSLDLIEHTTDTGIRTGALRKVYSLTTTGKAFVELVTQEYLFEL